MSQRGMRRVVHSILPDKEAMWRLREVREFVGGREEE
jgi:hypothetical protein